MSKEEFAQRIGLDENAIGWIIKGVEPITSETAHTLEKVLRVPAHFWLNLEASHRAAPKAD